MTYAILDNDNKVISCAEAERPLDYNWVETRGAPVGQGFVYKGGLFYNEVDEPVFSPEVQYVVDLINQFMRGVEDA